MQPLLFFLLRPHCKILGHGCPAGVRRLDKPQPSLDQGGRLFLADLGAPGREAARNWRYLLNPNSSGKKEAHLHPFLSPDGQTGFFNSDESGLLQAYLVRGW